MTHFTNLRWLIMSLLLAVGASAWGETGTITFGAPDDVKINDASVTGTDDLNNTWTITTVGTTSFTNNNNTGFSQVGSSKKPATSITFTTTLPSSVNITSMSAKFGGFSGTAGTITLKVDDTSIGTGSLNGANAVTVSSTSSASGNVLTVTVTGISKGVACYYISYTYETGGDTQLPTISADDATVAFDATSGEISYSIENPVSGATLSASSTDTWISNCTVNSSTITFNVSKNTGTSDRTGTITLTYANGGTTLATKEVSVTQGHETLDYVILPFSWDGGTSAQLTALDGVSAEGLGDDYAASNAPYRVKFDNDGDYILIKTDSQPGVVTIGVKMIGGTNTSSIKVQGSSDGETFTDIETLSISGSQNDILTLTTTNAFAESVRYVKLVFTKGSNVGVGPITISKPVLTTSIVAEDVELAAEATSGEIAYTINNPITGTSLSASTTTSWISNVVVDAPNNKVTFTTTTNAGDTRTGKVTLTYGSIPKDVTITQKKRVSYTEYTLASAIVSGKTYIFASGTNGEVKAMGEQTKNNRSAVSVTAENNKIQASDDAGVCEFVITAEGDNYTISDDSGYLYAASSSSNYLRTETTLDEDDNGLWSIVYNSENGSFNIIAQGNYTRNVMRFNSGNSLFACYGSASQSPVYLFEKVTDTPMQSYTVTIGSTGYATLYYGSSPLVIPEGVTAYTLHTKEVNGYTDVELGNTLYPGDKIAAGTGVILTGAQGEHLFPFDLSNVEKNDDDNILMGSDVATRFDESGYEYFVLGKKDGVVGFYHMTGTNGGKFVNNGAHKAFFRLPEGESILNDNTSSAAMRGGFSLDEMIATAIEHHEQEVKKDNIFYNLAGQRVLNPTKGIYIVNGKKVFIK